MSEYAPTHHAVTSGVDGGHRTHDHRIQQASGIGAHGSTNTDAIEPDTHSSLQLNNGVGNPDTNTTDDPRVIAGHSIDNHNDAYRASLEHLQSRKDSLSATPGPFNAPTTEDVSKGDVPPSSSVGSKNAPGKAGEVGEKIMGGFGVGGTHVERPKEEQGLGEKIVNFLGA